MLCRPRCKITFTYLLLTYGDRTQRAYSNKLSHNYKDRKYALLAARRGQSTLSAIALLSDWVDYVDGNVDMVAVTRCRSTTVWRWRCLATGRRQLVSSSATLSTQPFQRVRPTTSTDNFTWNVALTSRATPARQYVLSFDLLQASFTLLLHCTKLHFVVRVTVVILALP